MHYISRLAVSLLCFHLTPSFAMAATTDDDQTSKTPQVLTQLYPCSASVTIRSQQLSKIQQKATCETLAQLETQFHELFSTINKPVKHDLNTRLRVNVYQSREDYARYAGQLFDMPTDNGGMYLEGFPDRSDNQAEFITYMRDEQIWNLRHEYIHYLDGRYNIYGDFCASLHDSHSPPENCAKPAPGYPHTVWWSEGIAEYIAKQADNARAISTTLEAETQYNLSELFDTSYESNGGTSRVYSWGYLAARFMMEEQRDKVEAMLTFLRKGDFPRYQALLKSWGTEMDEAFTSWHKQLKAVEQPTLKNN